MLDSLQRWCDPRVILVATNLRDQPALMGHASAEAIRSGARLLLVHVIPPPAQPEDASANLSRVLLPPSVQSAADVLDRMALQLQWQGVFCEPVVLKGRPDEQIRALVESRRVDRVVVAARSRPRRDAWPQRSLAEALRATLPVPVFVLGGQAYPLNPGHCATERVLLALSLHCIRREYVDFACGVARARRARLTLLHVIDPVFAGDHQRAHESARLRLAALAANHDDLPWRPDIAVREGDPATQIVEEAACPSRDLIILGSSSLTSSGEEQGSGVIDRIIAEAHCPVITLKPAITTAECLADADWQILRTGTLD